MTSTQSATRDRDGTRDSAPPDATSQRADEVLTPRARDASPRLRPV